MKAVQNFKENVKNLKNNFDSISREWEIKPLRYRAEILQSTYNNSLMLRIFCKKEINIVKEILRGI